MRIFGARALRLAALTASLSASSLLGGGGIARADDPTCTASEVGTPCVGDGGASTGLTCVQVTTTITASDGGMSSSTAPTCVFISGTYCNPSTAGQPCGTAGDVCVAETEGASSGSTGGGEQTSATSYTYGVCQAPAPDGGDQGDDGGVAIANGSTDGGSGGVTTTAPVDGGNTASDASAGDSGATEPGSGDSSSSSGCTFVHDGSHGPGDPEVPGLVGLVVGAAMGVKRRRRVTK